MSFATLPDERAREQAEAAALADDDLALDNTEFLERVRRATGLLRAHGVGDGDVLALVLPNRVDLIVLIFAAWRRGAAATPVNPGLTRSEMQYQVDDSGAKLVIGDGLELDANVADVSEIEGADPDEADAADVPGDALALLIYTSGTTGKPKGVMLDHSNLDAMCESAEASMGVTAEDHCLLILPLFHVNAIVVSVLTPLLAGGRTTVVKRFSPKTFLDIVETVRPTYFSAVPAIYAMLSSLDEAKTADTSSLRIVVCGAAPMPAELIERVEKRYGVVLVEGYGLTEGTCASCINPHDGKRKPGTVGLPMAGQEVKLVDPDGNEVAQGGRGEVLISGPTVMRGYLNQPEETEKTVVDGWLHTGDVGTFDEDGYLKIVDRIKDMIIRGGENIYPKEIESVLYTHDGVLEAAVIGRPDETMGELVVAYVALRPESDATVEDLAELCESELAKYKRPVSIEIVDELPKNPVGKIDKRAIRANDSEAVSSA